MTLRQEIETMQQEMLAQIPEEALQPILKATERLVASGIAEESLTEGNPIPAFELVDANGTSVASADLLREGPLVISFYRGAWCPYCNLELKALQDYLPQIKELGANLIAISPNDPDHSLTSVEKHELEFKVLSDPGNKVARKFGLVFSLAEEIRPIYSQFGFSLPSFNSDETWELPIPATYVVDTNARIVHSFVNADYTQRQEPAEIIKALKKMKQSQGVGKR